MPVNQSLVTRDTARAYILEFLITSGYILPGDRLNLPFFAKRLDCSVTPLREAMAQLSHSGLVKVEPKRGFHLARLDKEEANKLLQAIIGLESQAILAAPPGQLNIRSLTNANEAISDAITPSERFLTDLDFHKELTRFFDGSHIGNLLFEMKVRLYFYMSDYFSSDEHTQQIIGTHKRIISRLENSDREGAIEALRQDWLAIKLAF
ncbi:MAG: GntR family transcriptional regulator [Saprospiraceae bacterium]